MKLKRVSLRSSVKFHLFLCLSVLVLGCASGAQSTRARDAGKATGESRQLNQVFEDYFEEYLKLFPTFATSIGDHRYDNQLAITIGEEHRAKERELYLKFLAALGKIEKHRFDASDAMNYVAFERLLKRRLEGLNFDQYLMPVRQLGSMPIEFPVLASGKGDHPFRTVADYDNFLGRIAGFQAWVDVAIANMRVGSQSRKATESARMANPRGQGPPTARGRSG